MSFPLLRRVGDFISSKKRAHLALDNKTTMQAMRTSTSKTKGLNLLPHCANNTHVPTTRGVVSATFGTIAFGASISWFWVTVPQTMKRFHAVNNAGRIRLMESTRLLD